MLHLMADSDFVPGGPWRRVYYARAHLDALSDQVEAYRERHKDAALRCDNNTNDAADRGVKIDYVFDIVETIPDHWRFMVGDVLHNLHSALENVIWSLAIQHSGPEPPNERSIGFPVFLEPENFDRVTPSTLVALHPEVLAVLKSLQPFEEDEPSLSPLYLLHQLNRLDKHRAVSVVRLQLHAFDIDVTPTPRDLEIIRYNAAALEHGTHVASVTFRRPTTNIEVDVLPVFAYYEAIEATSSTPLLPLGAFLETLILHVADCLAHLAPFLEPAT